MPPKSRIWRARDVVPGVVGEAGVEHRATRRDGSTSIAATACAFAQCRSMRTASVLIPRSTR